MWAELIVLLSLLVLALFWWGTRRDDKMVCMESSMDSSSTYCVRQTASSESDRQTVEMLALLHQKNQALLTYLSHLKTLTPTETQLLHRLQKNYQGHRIREAHVDPDTTSFSLNKSEIHYCLRSRDTQQTLYDPNLLFYVSLHELAHLGSISIRHTPEFYQTFHFLLHHAARAGLYQPLDFQKHPLEYCGLRLQ